MSTIFFKKKKKKVSGHIIDFQILTKQMQPLMYTCEEIATFQKSPSSSLTWIAFI